MYERIFDVVRQVPPGRVITYGQVSRLVGPPCDARTVGWALATLARNPAQPPVPWQRVINSQGRVSTGPRQQELLQAEGVVFAADGRVDLARFSWDGPR
ncbi:MAG: MGMT family protein [Candidatus Bipolaricaulaceae bacterium]